jgi:ectoine hydroxylase-related dioxygenase (phytanoyl-CoA dioxygenase family)
MQQLTDVELMTFLDQGYLVIPMDEVAETVHDELFQSATAAYDAMQRLAGTGFELDYIGDNLVARLPRLSSILQSSRLQGALTSVLGERYFRYNHCFVHQAQTSDQGFHKDSHFPWSLRGALRSHRPNWVMAFYYPQETTIELGATQIIPGSQYWNVNHEEDELKQGEDRLDYEYGPIGVAEDLSERDRRLGQSLEEFDADSRPMPVLVPKGSVVLVNFDLFHRGARRLVEGDRFMFKFWFARTMEPRPRAQIAVSTTDARRTPVVEAVAAWLTGQPVNEIQPPIDVPVDSPENEAERIQHAYAQGLLGDKALPLGILSTDESLRRAAMYGVTAAGELGLEVAVAALLESHKGVRKSGAFVLGELAVNNPDVVYSLARVVMADECVEVRCTAVTALGKIARKALARGDERNVEQMIDAICPAADPGREPNQDTKIVPMSAVRQAVALALLGIVTEGITAGLSIDKVETLSRTLTTMMHDTDRYAAGTAIEAVSRLASGGLDSVVPAILYTLNQARWAPTRS